MRLVVFLMAVALVPGQGLALDRGDGDGVPDPAFITEPGAIVPAGGVGVNRGPTSMRVDRRRGSWGTDRSDRRRNRNVGAGKTRTATPRFKAPPAGPRRRLEAGGNHRSYSVYGDTSGEGWRLGETLPAGMPFAKLKHRSFGLPEPHDGQSWVRVEGAVLLIEDASREILWVVEQ